MQLWCFSQIAAGMTLFQLSVLVSPQGRSYCDQDATIWKNQLPRKFVTGNETWWTDWNNPDSILDNILESHHCNHNWEWKRGGLGIKEKSIWTWTYDKEFLKISWYQFTKVRSGWKLGKVNTEDLTATKILFLFLAFPSSEQKLALY